MSEIGIKSHLQRLATRLGILDVTQFPSQLDTSSVKPVLDIGQGGWMGRTMESGESAAASVAGQLSGVVAMISPSAADLAILTSSDGNDRRVVAASCRFLWAGNPGLLISWRWFLKPSVDASAEVDIAYAHKAGQMGANSDDQLWLPLWGYTAWIQNGDPAVSAYPSMSVTWNGVVPTGWAFFFEWWAYDAATGAAAACPALTTLLRRVAVVRSPAGISLPM